VIGNSGRLASHLTATTPPLRYFPRVCCKMGHASLSQEKTRRLQEWLSHSVWNDCQNVLPSPPPLDANPCKRKFVEAFPTTQTPMPRPVRSDAGSTSSITDLIERTNFTVPSKAKGESRSPSPTRKLMRLLEEAEPPLRCYQQGTVELPPSALDLLRTLSRNLWKGVIPSCFQVSCYSHRKLITKAM
jgi:hypothetical protein